MKILAFSDVHGKVSAVRELIEIVKGNKYDAVIFAGDFASFWNVQEIYEKIMDELKKIGAPCYYVFGNRDRTFDPFGIGIYTEPEVTRPIFLENQKIELGEGIFITANPELIDENTIFLAHRARHIEKEALLHIEGHVHAGIIYKNYLNLGFLYRDEFHDETPGMGCYWEIEIGKDRKFEFHCHGFELIKPISCNVHKSAQFFVPEDWTICPFCVGEYFDINWPDFFMGDSQI